jgi:nitrile hydratase subunit beta
MKLQHCLGGLEGLGPVTFDKRVFAEPWEKRIFGINLALLGLSEHLSEARPPYPIENIPTTFKRKYTAADLRKRVEGMHPFDYFRYRYYEKWLASVTDFLLTEGYISERELEARTTAYLNHEDLPAHVRLNEAIDKQAVAFLRGGDSAHRDAKTKPRFTADATVKVKDVKPVEHTRLPGYLRAKTGVVETVYEGCYAYPVSTGPDGLGEPMAVYLVRFDPRDIWGDLSESKSLVYAGIYETYLQAI